MRDCGGGANDGESIFSLCVCVCVNVNDQVSIRMSATPSVPGRTHARSSSFALGTWDISMFVVCILGVFCVYL